MIEKIFYHTDTVSNQIFEKNSAFRYTSKYEG